MEKLSFKQLGLGEKIIKALDMLNYKNPSEVQEKSIPLILENKDVIVKSQTGSGKTAAFGIPICEKIDIEERNPKVLVLTPTRELAVQIKEDISNIGRLKKVRCAAIFGKQPMKTQMLELKQRVHVVVGTPGRTLDHIDRGNMELRDIKYLIIDEADEMLNMGFIDQVESIIKILPKKRTTMLFSATMPTEIEKLSSKYMIDPIKIEINPKKLTTEKIEQYYYEVEENKKFTLLNKVIYTERPESAIFFCSTKAGVNTLLQKMKNKGYSAEGLHGGMEQKDRLNTMQRFKRGEFRFLVATDVAARGIDIENITHVINYNVPLEKESYVHRIGRTGRAGNKGKAITFVTPYEDRFLSQLEEYINCKLTKKEEPTKEEVISGKQIFESESKKKITIKKDKSANLNKKITKIHINAGKKKKIRVGDIVGAVSNIKGINKDDIGIIDVQDNFSYVDIFGDKGDYVIEQLRNSTVKGKKVRVQKAKK